MSFRSSLTVSTFTFPRPFWDCVWPLTSLWARDCCRGSVSSSLSTTRTTSRPIWPKRVESSSKEVFPQPSSLLITSLVTYYDDQSQKSVVDSELRMPNRAAATSERSTRPEPIEIWNPVVTSTLIIINFCTECDVLFLNIKKTICRRIL